MKVQFNFKKEKILVFFLLFILISCIVYDLILKEDSKGTENVTFAMSTVVTQTVYGPNAEEAIKKVNQALFEWENKFSMYRDESYIAKINAASGEEWVSVDSETLELLTRAKELSKQSEGAYAVTIAPLTNLWGINSDTVRIPSQDEIDEVLPLVNDSNLLINDNNVKLAIPGMGIDLGGIAKGAFLSKVKSIYSNYGIESAVISIGGNVLTYGNRPDGELFNVGFKDPYDQSNAAIIQLSDSTIATSGGYERYIEVNNQKYIHIFDPIVGYPVESDVVTVGVVSGNGLDGDFWSTTLLVSGVERTLEYMRSGIVAIMIADDDTLYISSSLKDKFQLLNSRYNVVYIE